MISTIETHQQLFTDSIFDKVSVKSVVELPEQKETLLNIMYPVTYDMSREIFKIIPNLKQYDIVYSTVIGTASKQEKYEIIRLVF